MSCHEYCPIQHSPSGRQLGQLTMLGAVFLSVSWMNTSLPTPPASCLNEQETLLQSKCFGSVIPSGIRLVLTSAVWNQKVVEVSGRSWWHLKVEKWDWLRNTTSETFYNVNSKGVESKMKQDVCAPRKTVIYILRKQRRCIVQHQMLQRKWIHSNTANLWGCLTTSW